MVDKVNTCLFLDMLCFYNELENEEGRVFLYDYFSRRAVGVIEVNDLVKCDVEEYIKMVVGKLTNS